ncbi:MAG: hypothetical protein PHN90_13320 [Methanothrix sp.]|nr:hypothetical protein [Methanothrix sp.]
MIRQADLFNFAEGSLPPRGGDVDDEGEELPVHTWGRRCAKCGRRLGGGGLEVVGYGLCCWRCYNSTTTRRDGRGDASSDAAGERNSGYNLRR